MNFTWFRVIWFKKALMDTHKSSSVFESNPERSVIYWAVSAYYYQLSMFYVVTRGVTEVKTAFVSLKEAYVFGTCHTEPDDKAPLRAIFP